MTRREPRYGDKNTWMCFFLVCALAAPAAGISVSCSTSAGGETVGSQESFSLNGSTSLQESLLLGSGSISAHRQSEGKGNNSLKQSLTLPGRILQNDINSQGEFASSTTSAVSGQWASIHQRAAGTGSMNLELRGRKGDTDAGQEASVSSGTLRSSQSLSAAEGISASQSTEIQGLEGGVLAGALGSDNVMVAKGSFEGLGSMKADLGATTQDQASITGTASIDGAPLLSGHTFRALSLNDEGRGVGISGLRMVDGGLGNFDVSVISSDLNDASGRPYASKEYNPIASSGGSSSSYVLTGFRWNQENPNIQLYLNPTDIPPGIKAESARDAISAAANTWDDAVHKNLFTDKSTVIIDYSKEVPNPFSGDYRADGINTNGFRNFGNNYLAVSIFWTDLKKEDGYYSTIESDILYNLDFKWTDDLKQAESSGRLDLQSVAIHELGHAIGLDDLYTLDNSDARKYDFDQVMNLYNGPQRTLGNGDKAGAQVLYGMPTATENISKKIALQVANGQYLCAENGGGSFLVANRDLIQAWETFGLIDLGENKVALQAINGQYVCAENGGNSNLVANRDWILAWETFGLIDLGENKVALQAINGKYVCAENGGGSDLVANRDWILKWETFGIQAVNL
jgi:hypothetical protein